MENVEILSIQTYNVKGENIYIPYNISPINSFLTTIILDLKSIDAGTYFFSLTNSHQTKETLTIIKN